MAVSHRQAELRDVCWSGQQSPATDFTGDNSTNVVIPAQDGRALEPGEG